MKKNNKYNFQFLKNYKNKKVLITGSTGFKGAWLSYWLYLLGSNVVGIGLRPEKSSILFHSLKLKKKIKQYYLDIRNYEKLNKIIKKEKPQIIFHLAAQSIVSTSYREPLVTFGTNIIGSANVLESVRKNKIKNLVYITSDKCYLNLDRKKSYKEEDTLGGLDNYSSSKASAEIIFKSFFSSYSLENYLCKATARAGNVIGGGDLKKDRIIPDIIRSIIINKNIKLRNPNATRPWQHVLEPLSGYLLLGNFLMKKKLKKSIVPSWNFGPYKKNCKKVIEIAKNLLISTNSKLKIKIQKNKQFHESKFLSLNIFKAHKELGWSPTLTFRETINYTTLWYRAFMRKEDLEFITKKQINLFTSKIKFKKIKNDL